MDIEQQLLQFRHSKRNSVSISQRKDCFTCLERMEMYKINKSIGELDLLIQDAQHTSVDTSTIIVGALVEERIDLLHKISEMSWETKSMKKSNKTINMISI